MKPHLSIDEQIGLLIERGLEITDEQNFARFLLNNNYYRVRGYFHPFLLEEDGQIQNQFKDGASDIQVIHLVEFDRNLRNFLFEVLAIFETKLRSSLAYHAGKISPLVHITGEGLAQEFKCASEPKTKSKFDEWTIGYKKALENRAKNDIVVKHAEKYDGQIPIWAAVELLELGKITTLLKGLEEPISSCVAQDFNFGTSLFKSVVVTLNELRNQVAHHSRIWNFHYTTTPKISRNKLSRELHHLADIEDYQRHKLFT